MTWILIGYLCAGLAVAVRIVPWGERTYFLARYKSDTWHAKLVGGLAVLLVVALFWPAYAWITWRQWRAIKLLEFMDAAEAHDAADLAGRDFMELERRQASENVRRFLGGSSGESSDG